MPQGQQSDAQRQAALTDAGLTTTQQQGVTSGQGYDPSATGTPSPISRMVVDQATGQPSGADAASAFLDTFKAPQTADQIAEQKRIQSQSLIDSINKNYDDQVSQAKQTGNDRLAADNAISVLSGLTGSTEAVRTHNSVADANSKEQAAINNKRLLDLQGVYTKINQDAQTEAEQQLQDATRSAQDIVARRQQTQEKAIADIKQMAAGGLVDFNSFKNSPQNAKVYQYALDAVGGSEDALKAIFMANRPQDQLVGTPMRVGDHFVQAYKNPLTNAISYDTIQVPGGLPPEYSSMQTINGNLVAIPSNWDGDLSKLVTVAKVPPAPITLSEGQEIIDPKTGQVLVKNPKTYAPKAASGGSGSGGTGGTGGGSTGPKFSPTQINKGAQNAGLPGTDFTNLNHDVQNFYINGGKTLTALNSAISDVKSGAQSAETVKQLITDSNQPDAVKQHLIQRIDAVAPKQNAGGGGFNPSEFWQGIGTKVHSLLYGN